MKLPRAAACLFIASLVAVLPAQEKPAEVVLARDGKALLPIFVAADPVVEQTKKKAAPRDLDKASADLRRCLQRLTGAEFSVTVAESFPAGQPKPGVYIGRAKDFPWAEVPKDLKAEEFVLRSTPQSQVLLVAGSELGMCDATYALLEKFGCRWYFPGATWEVIPKQPTLALSLDERRKPEISLQRQLAMGHGLHSPAILRDNTDWLRRNRMIGTLHVNNSHTWPGISPEKDLATHPEWFALVNGTRKPSKPCYSHPEVIARGVAQSLAFFEKTPGAQMVSVSAPDGAGFCECELCQRLANVTKIYPAHGPGGLYGTTADGKEVSVVSETIFHYANQVADAVAQKYPGKYVGVIAYSSYSHPPSFALKPNVYVEITQGYRRTPLTLAEQIGDFAEKAKHMGIYEYYDVEQWSWDQPGKARAAHLDYHAASIPFYARNRLQSIKAEISNNWAPNGLGYYAVSKMMWDSSTDIRAVEEEFYRTAFGPAAEPLKRCYRRWESERGTDPRTLALAYRDLQEAVKLTAEQPEYRARVDHIRMYLHFLKSYQFLQGVPLVLGDKIGKQAYDRLNKQYGEAAVKEKVAHLGDYVRRLMDTNLIHSFAFNSYLKAVGKTLGCDTANWQKPGPIPSAAEIDKVFQEDLKDFDGLNPKDVEVRPFGHALIPIKEARPDLVKADDRKIDCEPWRQGAILVRAHEGDTVSLSLAPAKEGQEVSVQVTFFSLESFDKGWSIFGGERLPPKKLENDTLRLAAAKTGYYQIGWTEARITALSHPAILENSRDMGLRGGTLYFFVPKGTRSFLVRARAGGGPAFRIRDGRGQTVLEIERGKAPAGPPEFIVAVPEGSADAVWSIAGLRDPRGNGTVALSGVPNYLSLLPDQLLVPREVAGR